jgi:hypothetical protein
MKTSTCTICAVLLIAFSPLGPSLAAIPEKEYLTAKEIEKIQDAQELEQRVNIYLEAATLRLKTAEERLNGKESPPDDPFEFFSVEDMLEGYYRILKSVMLNLDDAFQKPRSEKQNLNKALKNLKDTTEKAGKALAVLKKIAEDKRLEEVWNAVNKDIDITGGAHEGAELGLSNLPPPAKKKGH